MPIGNHSLSLEKGFVYQNDHIFEIIEKMAVKKLSVIPVLDQADNYLELSLEMLIDKMAQLGAVKDPVVFCN